MAVSKDIEGLTWEKQKTPKSMTKLKHKTQKMVSSNQFSKVQSTGKRT